MTISNCYLETLSWVVSIGTPLANGCSVEITDSSLISVGLADAYSYALNTGANVSLDVRRTVVSHAGTPGANRGVNAASPGALASVADMTQTVDDNDVTMTSGTGIDVWQTFAKAGQDATVLIQENDVMVGGGNTGIATRMTAGDTDAISILDNTVTGQTTPADSPQYGISASFGGAVTMRGNTMKDVLYTSSSSSGLFASGTVGATIRDNTVENNCKAGITVYNTEATGAAVIEGNRVLTAGTTGIHLQSNLAEQPRGLIADNIVSGAGNVGISVTGAMDVINNTMVDGGNFDIWGSGDVVLANNILRNGVTEWNSVGMGSRYNSIVNTLAGAGPNPALGPAPDYELQTGSPAVDAGDATYGALAGLTDNDGTPRVVAGGIDIGAQELQSCAACNTFADAFEAAAREALTDGDLPTTLSLAYGEIRPALVAIMAATGCFTRAEIDACVDAWLQALPLAP